MRKYKKKYFLRFMGLVFADVYNSFFYYFWQEADTEFLFPQIWIIYFKIMKTLVMLIYS